jgi:hypothetical protein
MDSREFYEKCSTSLLESLALKWHSVLSGEKIRIIQDILEERKEKGERK